MKGATHAAIGANMAWVPLLFGLTVQPWFTIVGAFAALLPDLDASESKIKNITLGGRVAGIKVGFKPLAPLAMILSGIFGHRGALHSLSFVILVAIGAGFLIPHFTLSLWLVVVFGYLSHLILDSLTKSGVEFFWPYKKNFGLLPHWLRLHTGGFFDYLIMLIGFAGVILFLYYNFSNVPLPLF
ncbi:MAG: metal-dependent hydrolase [Patescibacteria group bacterium]|jgi:membrane-bound metal-dependent hydrolase YbcI (DUF457 family)